MILDRARRAIGNSCEFDHGKPVVFSPFGLGVLDVAVGKWLYDRALAAGEAVPVPDFFAPLDC